ncbi:MAG TPA: sigma-70 family RNA polymerase sigma factor [Thermoguttaceae bacterium]|nr:sigma-70 family RNA polymerase sigma factor [Thermoguttaceae bacterium]
MAPEKTPPPETVQLLARFREGEREALNELYRRYYDRIVAVVRLRLGPKLRARLEESDIVQEAFLASLQGLKNFTCQSEGDFFHWLCKLVENRIRDQADRIGAQKRNADREVPLEPQWPSAESVFGPLHELATMTSPATRAVRAEDVRRLEGAVDALPEIQREAILLVRYEGLSFAEAGAATGKTPDAVRMLVARAIVALGKSLGVVSS